MWKHYNPNPRGARVGDCVVRAISKALGKDWKETYVELCLKGLMMCDLPSANSVWGAYLRDNGYERYVVPNTCPECYTVRDFCNEYKEGTYILALNGHVVCVIDGNLFDSWDSLDEPVNYYWKETYYEPISDDAAV